MKKAVIIAFVLTVACAAVSLRPASAQFPIKIPKLPKTEKPKTEQPKTDNASSTPSQTTANDSSQTQTTQNSSVQNNSAQSKKFDPPKSPSVPLLLIDTIEINLKQQDKYWKFPNQRYYSNWYPQIRFNIFYDNNERMRYTAEWSKPDGSLWFSESLESTETNGYYESADGNIFKSPYSSDGFDKLSTDQTGTYAVKIFNTKTKEVLYQGKFNVKKSVDTPGDATMKNAYQFFVDNDWHLAIGYAGFAKSSWSKLELEPEVLLWFKGEFDRNNFEARLFYNNQEIASTDDGGRITDEMKSNDECVRGQEICRYVQYSFRWDKFKTVQESYMREKYANAIFTQDKPGEYTVKIFYKGAQVREAKFTIGSDGLVARNAFSSNVYPTLTMIPVKVMGTAEKWNPASWKTGMFYGNPIAGFTVQ